MLFIHRPLENLLPELASIFRPRLCVMAKRLRDVCALPESKPLWHAGRGFVVRDLPIPTGLNHTSGVVPQARDYAGFTSQNKFQPQRDCITVSRPTMQPFQG